MFTTRKHVWSKGPHKGKGDEWSTGAELVHTALMWCENLGRTNVIMWSSCYVSVSWATFTPSRRKTDGFIMTWKWVELFFEGKCKMWWCLSRHKALITARCIFLTCVLFLTLKLISHLPRKTQNLKFTPLYRLYQTQPRKSLWIVKQCF